LRCRAENCDSRSARELAKIHENPKEMDALLLADLPHCGDEDDDTALQQARRREKPQGAARVRRSSVSVGGVARSEPALTAGTRRS